MEIKQLQYFMRTAELQHVTKAATDLMVSQPYLSKVIADLEEELGVQLFDHVGRSIVLNPCGEALYKRIVCIFNELEDAKKELQNINFAQNSRITVVTNISQYMPGLLHQISKSNPDIQIRQLSEKRRDIIRMVKNGEVDFALCSPPIEEEANMETIHLRYERAVVIYPRGHWLKDYKEVSIDAIKNEAYISSSQGYGARDAFDLHYKRLGLDPKIIIETTDTGSIFKYVEKGLGIAAVPLGTVLQEPEFKDNYAILQNNAGGDIGLTWRTNCYISEAGKLFIENTKQFYRELNDLTEKAMLN